MRILSTAVLIFFATMTSAQLTENLKLTASDAADGDMFGEAVAVSGMYAVVGARGDDTGAFNSGSAYVFDAYTGQQLFKLTGSSAAASDEFGISVAVSDTFVIVGVEGDDDAANNAGSAYIFDVTTGQQLFKILSSDIAAGDIFGKPVAISGATAIAGASGDDDAGELSGAAYIFDATSGQQLFKLTASDAAADDRFGAAVAISGSTVIVGAYLDDDSGLDSGSVYVFDSVSGQQLLKLVASDASAGDEFGRSVAVSGGMAIIGAPRDSDWGINSGSAYVFDITTGQQLFKLNASDASAQESFGFSVSISGTTAVVGAINSGSAYVFDLITGEEIFTLTASDTAVGGRFGSSVAVSADTAVVGNFSDDHAGSLSGSAYVFDVLPCPGDIADDFGTLSGGDDMVSFGDFLALLGLIGPCSDGMPGCLGDIANHFGTLNGGDGQITFGDFLALLGLVGPCP